MSIQPQLSSVSTVLAELTERVSDLAESLSEAEREGGVAASLFEIERSLRTAARRLEQLVRGL